MRKKNNTGYFVRGAEKELMAKYGRKSPHFLWRIADSGGLGLSLDDNSIYEYLWRNRRTYLRPEFLSTFETNDKTH